MRTVMRPRYYCDYCRKVSGSKSAMATHELHCTANPRRSCRMCGSTIEPYHFAGILTAPGNTMDDWKRKMSALREATEDCPCCILAAIRVSGVQQGQESWDHMTWREPGAAGGDAMLGFNFKVEKAAYLECRRREAWEVSHG